MKSQYLYKINSIKSLTESIYKIELSPLDIPLLINAGQYIKLLCNDFIYRNFSVANTYNLDGNIELHIRIRQTNDELLKFLLNCFSTYQPICIEGPFGKNIFNTKKDIPLLLIASGIGIVPFVSLLRSFIVHKSEQQVFLIWRFNSVYDYYLKDLFSECIDILPNFQIKVTLQKDVFKYALKYFNTNESIKIYICGSSSFENSIIKKCNNYKLKGDNISIYCL